MVHARVAQFLNVRGSFFERVRGRATFPVDLPHAGIICACRKTIGKVDRPRLVVRAVGTQEFTFENGGRDISGTAESCAS